MAPDIFNALAIGDYKIAGQKAAGFAADQTISYLLEGAGLDGVAAPARLAVWPIEHGLNFFQIAVTTATFKNQMLLYFAARSAGNSYLDIINLQNADVMAADPNILLKNRDTITKYQDWLAFEPSYLVGSVPGYTPAQFYDYAEKQWLTHLAADNYNADQATIRDSFRAAAAPQKPAITQQPQDAVIASGQNATFTVAATGPGPFTYAWRFNGSVLPSATTASLTVTSPGQYQVQISNAAGTTPSLRSRRALRQ